ncbi:hypothetical protein AB0F77_32605 [Streptomyces sp. NPDC026672]|uniref:hypothetical protein n=1 Tax=unclassified Streptomyces TaxID=2593676 RepID=UPI0033EB232F
MGRSWEADPTAEFKRRLGKSASELGHSGQGEECPEIWELDNGDVVVIGRDLTEALASRLPDGVSIGSNERLVVIPRSMLISAKTDIPNV